MSFSKCYLFLKVTSKHREDEGEYGEQEGRMVYYSILNTNVGEVVISGKILSSDEHI